MALRDYILLNYNNYLSTHIIIIKSIAVVVVGSVEGVVEVAVTK